MDNIRQNSESNVFKDLNNTDESSININDKELVEEYIKRLSDVEVDFHLDDKERTRIIKQFDIKQSSESNVFKELNNIDKYNSSKSPDVEEMNKSSVVLYGKLFSNRLYFSNEDIDDISDDYVEYFIDEDICIILKVVLGSGYKYSHAQYKKLFNDLIGFPVREVVLLDKEYIKYVDKEFIEKDDKIVIYTENQLVKGNISVKELIKMGYKFYTSKSDYWMTDFDKLGYITSDDEYDENGVAFYIGSVYFNRPGVIWFIMSKEELDDMHPYDDDMNNIIQFLPEEVILYDTYFREVQENELFKYYVFKGQYDKDDCISHVSNKDIMNKVNNRYVILEETNNIGLVSRVNKSDIINIKRV